MLNRSSNELTVPGRAFLVVRRGGRWSDVLRLTPDQPAVIGRGSSNNVVIRSHQASRRHAEVRWDNGSWWVRDLGSRNGTRLRGQRLQQAQRLEDGDQIEVAGFSLNFVTRLRDALAPASRHPGSNRRRAETDDQLTIDPPQHCQVTQRLHESRYLDLDDIAVSDSGEESPNRELNGWATLFRLAYRLASADSLAKAAETALKSLAEVLPACYGGVYLKRDPSLDVEAEQPMELVAMCSAGHRSYTPPTTSMIDSVLEGRQAVLFRNLIDDSELQAADSRGQCSTQSAIVAPIAVAPIAGGGEPLDSPAGYLHLYSDDLDRPLAEDQLQLVMAASGVLGAAIDNLCQRGRLMRSLRRSRRAVDRLRQRLDDSVKIIGTSPPMQRLRELIRRVAATDTTVLVRGESGVGKELVAGAIHQASPRRDGPLICLNCAALAPTLLESELFGHEKGAFTGATEQKKGKFELADGGTLMLDEIGEMDVNLQAKLLRVLEGHSFERLGGHKPIQVDVRLVAATNRDLPAEVAAGRFRADLYYRLNVVEIVVPPLRDRGDDIHRLTDHYIEHFAEKTARLIEGVTPRARRALAAHRWAGNVRELKNVIERAVVLAGQSVIDVDDLALPAGETVASEAMAATPHASAESPGSAAAATAVMSLMELEREHLIGVLRSTGGNKSRAATILGIERSTLDRKLKRHGIRPAMYRE